MLRAPWRRGGEVHRRWSHGPLAVPTVHEDELRELRDAAELRDSPASLNGELKRDYGVSLLMRTGVNTGDGITGTEQRLATCDAVNVAARL